MKSLIAAIAAVGLFGVLVYIAVAIGFPLLVIWAINFLFGTAVPLSFKSWLAVVVLMAGYNAISHDK